jgi:hypothetical protein
MPKFSINKIIRVQHCLSWNNLLAIAWGYENDDLIPPLSAFFPAYGEKAIIGNGHHRTAAQYLVFGEVELDFENHGVFGKAVDEFLGIGIYRKIFFNEEEFTYVPETFRRPFFEIPKSFADDLEKKVEAKGFPPIRQSYNIISKKIVM